MKYFPLFTQLHILQLEQYSLTHLLRWWLKQPLTFSTTNKKPLIITVKIKILLTLIFALYLLSLLLNPLIFLLLLLFPLPLISLSLFIFLPFEHIKKLQTISNIKKELAKNKQLVTIAITGSFGKTSTKNFLYHILNQHQFTLKTPQSYNTLFSIAKVVNLELTRHHRYFIAEFAAYQPGDIHQLAQMTPPQYSIITGVGSQHLERFGSIDNITKTKFELAQNTPHPKNILLNLDSPPVKNQIQNNPRYKSCPTYSLTHPQANFYISQHQIKSSGIQFTLIYKKGSYRFTTPLFGTSNLQNLTAAISMAIILKTPIDLIQKAVSTMPQSPHRLQLTKSNKATLIDNTYSSNQTGFNQVLNDLKALPGKKAIITPGLVELGSTSYSIHQQLGRSIAPIFDTVILVGHNSRTKNLQLGIQKHSSSPHITYLNNHRQYWPTVKKLSQKHQWILLENDLPDNY